MARKIWPGKPGKPDLYQCRFRASAEVALDEPDWVPAESLPDRLEHIGRWSRENWTLAFGGHIRAVSGHDADILLDQLTAAAGTQA